MRLRTENLTVSYGAQTVLDGLSLALPAGKITALLGPNGCGKSTLLNCFSRLLTPDSGEILLDEKPIAGFSARQLARRLALLPQHHLSPEGITVRELVSYGRSPWLSLWGRLSAEDNERVNVAMSQTRTRNLADRRLTQLSGGQRQRAFLAMVLAQDTPLILLDEPTTYLDINHQVELMRLMVELKRQGKTVVTVLHDLNQASRYCDHLVVLASGRVMAQGAPEAVMKPELLKTVFSVEAEIHPDVCGEVVWRSHKDHHRTDKGSDNHLPTGTKIWLVAGITDMRNGFNGLAAKVQTMLKDDPMSGHVFIFRGRSGSKVKLLWSTGDGLCLLTKRLERGRFAWPSARDGKVFLTPAQLAMLLEGIDWRQPKRLLTSLTML